MWGSIYVQIDREQAMTGHETVQKLRELEHSGKELQRFAALNKAAGLLIDVAGAFKEGDRCLLRDLRYILEEMREGNPVSGTEWQLVRYREMIIRLQAAAERLER